MFGRLCKLPFDIPKTTTIIDSHQYVKELHDYLTTITLMARTNVEQNANKIEAALQFSSNKPTLFNRSICLCSKDWIQSQVKSEIQWAVSDHSTAERFCLSYSKSSESQ